MNLKKADNILVINIIFSLFLGFIYSFNQFFYSIINIINKKFIYNNIFIMGYMTLRESFKQWLTLAFIILLFLLGLYGINKLFFPNFAIDTKIRNIYKKIIIYLKKYIIYIAYCLFLVYGGWILNLYFFPSKDLIIKLPGNSGFLIFMILWGWSIHNSNNRKTIFKRIFIGILIFMLFLYLFTSININRDIIRNLAFRSLPYVTWTSIKKKDKQKSGVFKYDKQLSFNGLNLYYSENKAGGNILDMHGNIVHTFLDKREKKCSWKLIEPYGNDFFLVLSRDKSLFMIDWNSKIQWIKNLYFHHDVAVAANGDVYTLINKKIYLPRFTLLEPILDNCLVILTKNGGIKKQISLMDVVLKNEILSNLIKKKKKRYYDCGRDARDVFHTNTIEIITKDVYFGNNELFKQNDVLLCMRNLNLICVLDIKEEKIIWNWGKNNLDLPHHPSLLENGNILIFDNGTNRKYSRVIELNPHTKKIEWEYKPNPPESFYSSSRGSAQRLPNGNTLITESMKGHVFEITRNANVTWRFFNTEILEGKNKRATIYRMMRITDAEYYRDKIK